jgi:MarR family transcriptional regulator, transcriptional regulator for hemolysin
MTTLDRHATLGFLLKDVSRLYARRFLERAADLGLTLPQCKALAYLAKNEGVSQKRLAELIEVDQMSLVRILDRMEADGFVQRCSDPQDRRVRSLRITEKARPMLDEIQQRAGETRAETLQGLTDAERTLLVELLERVHANLSSLQPLAAAPAEGAPPAHTASASR